MHFGYYEFNRRRFYEHMEEGSVLILFSGVEIRRSSDEFYPFSPDRNFVYMTGLSCKESVFLALKDGGSVLERLYLLPPDLMAERWTGRRITPVEAEFTSGVKDIRFAEAFESDVQSILSSGNYGAVYLDCRKYAPQDISRLSHSFADRLAEQYPNVKVADASTVLSRLRLIKSPEEINALRQAEKKTNAGIQAMMRVSRPGMWE